MLLFLWCVGRQGSPLIAVDLGRAGIRVAMQGIIFKQQLGLDDDGILIDADTLSIYSLIRSRNPKLEVTARVLRVLHLCVFGCVCWGGGMSARHVDIARAPAVVAATAVPECVFRVTGGL